MISTRSCLLALGTCVIVSGAAQADAPMVFKSCTGVKSVTGQGVMLYGSDCKSGFLLPSVVGTLKITGAFFSISQQSCAAVKDAETAALGVFGDAASREERRKQIAVEIKEISDSSGDHKTELSNYEAAHSRAATNVSKLEASAEETRARFQNECGGEEGRNFACLELSAEIRKTKLSLDQASARVKALKLLLDTAKNEAANRDERVTTLQKTLEALNKPTSSAEHQNEAIEALAKLRRQQGAVVSATLTTPLADDLKRVRDANRGTPYALEQMRFTGGSLHVAGTEQKSPELLGLPVLEVPGQSIEAGGTLFVNAAGARLIFDTVAACQIFGYKKPAENSLSSLTDQISSAVVAKAYLRYKALLGVKAVVRMDYKKFYELLVKSESKNGFFKTSTVKSVAEKMTAENTLRIDITDEGVLTADAREALRNGMRDRVVQRALDFLSPKYVGINPNAGPGKTQAGAPQLAASLRQCPNQWCQVAAVVVDVANSIWGGSESIQSFVQNLSVKSEESFSEADAFEFVTDLTFAPRK